MRKFLTAAFNICNFIFEFISTFAKLFTKNETISVLVEILSQNSPIIYNAAHLAFESVKVVMNSIFIN